MRRIECALGHGVEGGRRAAEWKRRTCGDGFGTGTSPPLRRCGTSISFVAHLLTLFSFANSPRMDWTSMRKCSRHPVTPQGSIDWRSRASLYLARMPTAIYRSRNTHNPSRKRFRSPTGRTTYRMLLKLSFNHVAQSKFHDVPKACDADAAGILMSYWGHQSSLQQSFPNFR